MKKSYEIGQAPLAGYTNKAMRELALGYGADFVFSEMISCESILRGDISNLKIIPKKPCRIQLFTGDPDCIGKAAEKLKDIATWFDINAACPVKKVIKKGAGSALLKDLDRLKKMLKNLKNSADVPVSVKIRLGWDKDEIEWIVTQLAEEHPDAFFIHGRTSKQRFYGKSSWDSIKKAVRLLEDSGIKIYGSGDLFTPEDIKISLNEYGVDGVIVARGAIGNAWIFHQTKELLKKGQYKPVEDETKIIVFRKQLNMLIDLFGERKGIFESRKYFAAYTKGLKKSRVARAKYMTLNTLQEISKFLTKYINDIKRNSN
ncbi:MAG: tRNA-dihydrouridine synthase [Thermotogota bacterium]|nr:tRNA-dihydrouridine synthase [Thermotogota bacterium]